MKVVRVNPGDCGFISVIKVTSTDDYNYEVTIKTDCPHIIDLRKDLTTFNLVTEMKNVFGEQIRDASVKHIRGSCVGCLVPPSILKAAQADAGFALGRNAEIQFVEG